MTDWQNATQEDYEKSEIGRTLDYLAERKTEMSGISQNKEWGMAKAIPLNDPESGLLSELGIDLRELIARGPTLAANFKSMVQDAISKSTDDPQRVFDQAIAGFWVDGLMTGIVVQREREKQG